MGGNPKVYNIQMDPHQDHNVAALFGWVGDHTEALVGEPKNICFAARLRIAAQFTAGRCSE